MNMQEILAAVEFGFRQAEKGQNLQAALAEARKVFAPAKKVRK